MRFHTRTFAIFFAVSSPALLGVCGCRKADQHRPAEVKTIRTATGVEMVLIPAGEFTMGCPEGEPDERPAHAVRVRAFYMDRTEVTQQSFESLTGSNPSKFRGSDRPVERVGWLAAARYCNARSKKEGLTPCYDLATRDCNFPADGYRLPTEAEWEYACGPGASGPALGDCAWFGANAGRTTHAVGRKRANSRGLLDMQGNVAEWCNDWYDPRAYAGAAPGAVADDPRGPKSGDYRVLRGGSWRSEPQQCRPTARMGELPGSIDTCLGYEAYGFRCVRRP